MYGKWFLSVFGFGILVLLVIALLAAPWVPILAVAIALVIGGAIWMRQGTKRTQQLGSEHAAAARDRREAGQPARPSATAAPHSGEG